MVDIADITYMHSVINVSHFLNALKNQVKKQQYRKGEIKLKILLSNKQR